MMKPLVYYLIITFIGMTVIRCTIQQSPMYERLQQRQEQIDKLYDDYTN